MSRYATDAETRRIKALLSTGGSWTRHELGRTARVCLSHVDSALRSISYTKDARLTATRSEPRLYELRERR